MIDPRISQFESRHHCQLSGFLSAGPGQDGFVLRSNRLTAVKFFDRRDRFLREFEVYHILQADNILSIAEHNVPILFGSDDELQAIEMTIVDRPFLLDFAGAKLPHEVPDFEQHVLDEHLQHLQELFGDRWADAIHVTEMFRQQTGFILLNIHPGNVAFED